MVGAQSALNPWDNPFAGTNFYEQSVGGPYGIYFSGGKGNSTEAIYSLITADRQAVAGYLPSTHGFLFANSRPSIHITSITLPDPFGDIAVGNASWGLCGGMTFASRDYFEAKQLAPAQTTNPTGEGDPLFDYIVRRLAQSLNLGDAANFVKYADPVYPDTDDPTLGFGRDWVMARITWPGIRDTIDSGHPCPMEWPPDTFPTLLTSVIRSAPTPTNYRASCLQCGSTTPTARETTTSRYNSTFPGRTRSSSACTAISTSGTHPYASSLSPTNSEFRSWEG